MNKWVVITSILSPTLAVQHFGFRTDWSTVVVGDRKSPESYEAQGIQFTGIEQQKELGYALCQLLPENHYSRKNLGYLLAIQGGALILAESDDDNRPLDIFLSDHSQKIKSDAYSAERWLNVYRYYSDEPIWPRGFPLEHIADSSSSKIEKHFGTWDCPIQQFLANGDPDVDAIYRMIFSKSDHEFLPTETIVLASGTYTPFNSQSTVWFPQAFPLLYLPSYVSFRMTDIWRSFVAQICLHAVGQNLAYMGAGVTQDRNPHDLLRDFRDEVPGYLNNDAIIELLLGLKLSSEIGDQGKNLFWCYEALTDAGLIAEEELGLVEAWCADLNNLR